MERELPWVGDHHHRYLYADRLPAREEHSADAGTFIDGDIPLDRTAPLATATGMRLGEAVRTPFFWVVALAVTLFFYGMFGWLVHQVPSL
ncbi:MAG: hypothetical protein R3B97_15485 [Dehalococcoidia bacterium]